jgi:D-3-phosphoglycerate dehydrogenase
MTPHVFVARDPRITALLDSIATSLERDGLQVVRGPMPSAEQVLEYSVDDYEALFGNASVMVFSRASLCSRELLAYAKKARGVVYPAIGVETIDLEAANALGLIVAHGAVPENYQGMAEATVMLMLALSFGLARSERTLRDGLPKPSAEETWVRPLRGRTIGFVGFGRIARAAALLLQPFGAKLVAHQPNHQPHAVGQLVEFVSLETLLRQADFVSVHVTINQTSKRLIGAKELAMMKPTAYLINTARGQAVVEEALVDALENGRIAGAALDTFEVEPLPLESPLRRLDNVILTPHMVGQTRESLQALVPAAVDNVRRILAGTVPVYCKNPQIEAKWTSRLEGIDAAAGC